MYNSETEKIYPIVEKYLSGKIVDIGAGGHKITPDAIAVDARSCDGTNIILGDPNMIYHLSKIPELSNADCVFSSHTLEHLVDDYAAIWDWGKLLKPGGYFILYLPDGRLYSNEKNEEHCRDYTYDNFMLFFKRCFCGEGKNYYGETNTPIFTIVESNVHFKPDCYSFYLISKKI